MGRLELGEAVHHGTLGLGLSLWRSSARHPLQPMMFFKKCYIDTTEQVDCVPMTHEVHYAIRDAGTVQGLVTITIPAPEAAVAVGEAVPETMAALRGATARWLGTLESAVVRDAKQRSVNVAARVQSTLVGRSVTLPFDHGRLLLDPYSEVLLIDYEPKRQRREVIVTVFGATAAETAPEAPQ